MIYIPSVGASDAFVIGNHALDFAAYTTGRGLYYQRCGYHKGHMAPYADDLFQRLPCHESPVSSDDGDGGVDAPGLPQYSLPSPSPAAATRRVLSDLGQFDEQSLARMRQEQVQVCIDCVQHVCACLHSLVGT